MNAKNKIVQNSLRPLQHPATWLSIALLVVNDHILKIVCPSWITGKLSDFAGLFFFPFIVAAGLSLLLSKYDFPSKTIGQIAFAIVGIWFILLKTFPLVNILTAGLASTLVRFPARFVMDPTDLVALFAMFPAWLIWRQPRPVRPTSASYAALVLGSLAAVATSPRQWAVLSVTNLEYYRDGIVYAADYFGREMKDFPVAESVDGGVTWQETTEVENIKIKSLPVQFCGRLNPEICYRLTNVGILQEWGPEREWISVGEVSVKGRDMILFEWNDKEYVLVAIGEHGVLRRELPDGAWEVIPVIYADEPLEEE